MAATVVVTRPSYKYHGLFECCDAERAGGACVTHALGSHQRTHSVTISFVQRLGARLNDKFNVSDPFDAVTTCCCFMLPCGACVACQMYDFAREATQKGFATANMVQVTMPAQQIIAGIAPPVTM